MSLFSHVLVAGATALVVHHIDKGNQPVAQQPAPVVQQSTFIDNKGRSCVQVCQQSSCNNYCQDSK